MSLNADIDDPEPNVHRGYTHVPTADVERYVAQQTRTFAFGLVFGAVVGAAVGRTLFRAAAPVAALALGDLSRRRRRRR